MDYFGGHQFQLLASLLVIVGAAFVALVCDFLKAKYEQLRENALELKFRDEHGFAGVPSSFAVGAVSDAETKTAEKTLARQEMRAAEKLAAAGSLQKAVERVAEKHSSAADPQSAVSPKSRRDSRLAREAEAAMERGSDIVAVRPRRIKTESSMSISVPDHRLQRKAAMRSRREQPRAVESTAAELKAVTEPIPAPSEIVPEVPGPKPSADQKNLLDEILAATAANTLPSASLHRDKGRSRNAIRADLFSAIESRINRLESVHGPSDDSAEILAPAPAERLERAIEASGHLGPMPPSLPGTPDELPAGLQDGFVLSKLGENRKPVSGLVVSIGLGNSDRKTARIPEPVHNLIRSLLGAEDFGCQSGEDEFLLIFPNERGAAAQRKLDAVAERLWDFQLRSMGEFSILFSWGGVEVNGESITDAIHSANQRMQDMQRGRNLAGASAPQPLLVSVPAQGMAV